MWKSSRIKQATVIALWVCAFAVSAIVQSQIPLPPKGTLIISCQLDRIAFQKGKIYVDGLEVGSCPGVTVKALAGIRSVRVGEALGNNRYLVYENEQVAVRKDRAQNITATLTPSTGEKSPSLAFALGVKQLSTIQPPENSNIAAFSPDTSVLAIGAETNSVQVYNVADGKALHRLGEVGEYWVSFVTALSFSANGQVLASNGWHVDKYIGEINIWDVKSGQLTRTIPGVKTVSALALSPDGKLLAAGVEPNTINLWNVADGKLLWSFNPKADGDGVVRRLFFSPDGRTLIFGHNQGDKNYIYDAMTARHRFTVSGRLLNLTNDWRLITYLYKNPGSTRAIWSADNGKLIESKQVKYTPDENGLSERIIVSRDMVWDATREQVMWRLPDSFASALSADGRRLLSDGSRSRIIWSLPDLPGNAPD